MGNRPVRLATWNINGLRARLDYVTAWLADRQPDVVGFQELKMVDDLFPTEHFSELGYHALTHGQKAWNGVAILSREPAEPLAIGLHGQDEMGARLIGARVGGIAFTTVYCPNGKSVEHEDYGRKLAWFEDLAGHMQERLDGEGSSVLCGDFNICVAELDSHDPEGHAGTIFHTDEERARMRRLFDLGLHDVYRERNPDGNAFSWWDYRAGGFQRNLGLRIDLMLATPDLLERVTDISIDRDYRKKKEGLTASDHAPVILDLTD